jgi:hypothetical protein
MKMSDHVQDVLRALTVVIGQFAFKMSKEEEVIRGQVWVVSRMQQVFGF